MRSIVNRKILSFAVLCTSFFVFVPYAFAICCKCVPQNMDQPPTTCFTVTTLKDPQNCTTLPTEQKIDGYDCSKTPLTDAQCKKITGDGSSGGGICTGDPEAASPSRKGETVVSEPSASTDAPSLLPSALQFNTPIPGFVAPTDMGLLFATYMIAIYRYMIAIAIFVTTVMFIWGAFRYLVGSSMGNVSRGKEIMRDAVVGLLLVLSANLILRTINPQLVKLNNLDITPISPKFAETIQPDTGKTSIGSAKNDCLKSTFGGTDTEVRSHLSNVAFLGDNYVVQEKAVPDFQAALQELEHVSPSSPAGG